MASDDLLPTPSYSEAVAELARCAHWSKDDVRNGVDGAYWQASAWLAKCKRVVERRDR